MLSGVKPETANRRSQRDISGSKNYEFTKYLRNFMLDFTSIMKDVSNYQVNRLNNLKNDNEPELEVFGRLIEQVTKNKQEIEDIEANEYTIADQFREVKSSVLAHRQNL